MRNDVFHLPGMKAVTILLLLVGIILLMLRMPAEAGERCIRLSKVSGYETLVNTCGSCRNVQINRDRSGISLPTVRSYQIAPYKKWDLTFKGPGRTRIISDEACNLEAGIDQIEKKKAQDFAKRCVMPVQTARGLVMVNGCTACRKVVLERTFPDGSKNLTPYSFDARDTQVLKSDGALQARIVVDKPCNI